MYKLTENQAKSLYHKLMSETDPETVNGKSVEKDIRDFYKSYDKDAIPSTAIDLADWTDGKERITFAGELYILRRKESYEINLKKIPESILYELIDKGYVTVKNATETVTVRDLSVSKKY